MNRGSQPSVNSLCCLTTAALANRDGTTMELFIPRVILLTVGNSGKVAGKISLSSIASSSLFTNSKLFFHAGTLKISCLLAIRRFRFQKIGISLNGAFTFSPHPALQLPPEVKDQQLGILHLPKEHRVTHLCPQHLLSTPFERCPIQQAQVYHRLAVSRH